MSFPLTAQDRLELDFEKNQDKVRIQRKGLLVVSEVRYVNNFNSDRKDDPASILLGLQAPVGKVLLDAGLSLGLNTAAPDYVLTMGVTIKF